MNAKSVSSRKISRMRFILWSLAGTAGCLTARNLGRDARNIQQIRAALPRKLFEPPAWHAEESRNLETNGAKITPVSTRDADFLFWFTRHAGIQGGKPRPAPEKYNLGLKEMRALKKGYPHLIYAPEISKDQAKGLRMLRKNWKAFCSWFVAREDWNFLTEEAALHLSETSTPILWVDYNYFGASAEPFFGSTAVLFNKILFWGLPPVWGAAAGHYFTKPEPSRRSFLKGAGLLSAGATESCLNPRAFQLESIPIEVRYPNEFPDHYLAFYIEFRNALIAYKLLDWAKKYREETGHRPAFLLPYGLYHKEITQNLINGKAYNIRRIEELCEEIGLSTMNLNDSVSRGLLITAPGNKSDKPIVEEITFDAIREALLDAA